MVVAHSDFAEKNQRVSVASRQCPSQAPMPDAARIVLDLKEGRKRKAGAGVSGYSIGRGCACFTCPKAKLDSIEATPSSRVSVRLRNAS